MSKFKYARQVTGMGDLVAQLRFGVCTIFQRVAVAGEMT
jgi:hypothetical protein